MRRDALGTLAAALVVCAAARPGGTPADVPAVLAHIGQRVERYYARAQSIMCLETVRLQPLAHDLSFDGGHVRQLIYELRISWEPPVDDHTPPEAKVLRELLKVDGHTPRPGEEPGCLDPKPVSTEPLAMLLPARQRDYAFTWAGTGRTDRRESVMLDYKATTVGQPSVTFKGECISVELPGRDRGRVWTDAETGDVLRLDEGLTGMFEFRLPKEHMLPGGPTSMVIERADSSIKYLPVTFHDPDETVMLPASVSTLTVIRNSGSPRMRMTQTFSNYKRFMTGGRIVKDPGAR
jgi:hypothetical protein